MKTLLRLAALTLLIMVTVGTVAARAQGTLFVEGNNVGIGIATPFSALTIAKAPGAISTEMSLFNADAGAVWFYSATGAGNFVISKAGTGGNEFTTRERNHAIATLDVEGHVRGTSFVSTSGREFKTAFEEIDSLEVLNQMVALPVTAWRYKTETEDVRHIGPVAEDFQSLFGLGDGRGISTVDSSGVIMAAIQGLNRLLELKEQEISDLEARLAKLEERLASTE